MNFPVNIKHAATIVTTGGALVAWFVGGATTNHTAPPTHAIEPATIDIRYAELATEVSRLHDRLQPSTRPQQPARNLFRFRPTQARSTAAPIAAPTPVVDAPPPPPVLLMKLVGMAEDPGPDGPVRMAFLNIEGQFFSVKEGETIVQKYRVSKMSADVVELTDVNDGSVRRLALR
jgi:hypothetical protein